jgi:putative ABC transport system permease protein
MLSERMAREYWRGLDPLKDHILIGQGLGPEFADQPRQIVGIVGNVLEAGLNSEPDAEVYVPAAQISEATAKLVSSVGPWVWIVRTESAPAKMAQSLRAELEKVCRLQVGHIRTMSDVTNKSLAKLQIATYLISALCILAGLLAVIGVYGILDTSLRQRRKELAVRLALGASSAQVRLLVAFDAAKLVLPGLSTGVGLGWSVARLVARFVVDFKPWNPAVFAAVPLLELLVASLVIWLLLPPVSDSICATALRQE